MPLTLPPPELAAAFLARIETLLALAQASAEPDQILVWPRVPRPDTETGQTAWEEARLAEADRTVGGAHRFTSATVGTGPGDWPPDLPLPLSLDVAIDRVAGVRQRIAEDMAQEVERLAHLLVEPKYVPSVLGRCLSGWRTAGGLVVAPPVERWPWPTHSRSAAGVAFRCLVDALDPMPHTGSAIGPRRNQWPPEAAMLDVARWARERLNSAEAEPDGEMLGERLLTMVTTGLGWVDHAYRDAHGVRRYPGAGIAFLFLAERDVRDGLARPVVAVSASKEHHDFMLGAVGLRDMRRKPDDPLPLYGDESGRLILTRPGDSFQLAIPFDGSDPHGEVIIRIKEMFGQQGAKFVRHWVALTTLWGIDGGRLGYVRWTLDDHMRTLGYHEDTRWNPRKRAEAAAEVEHLTRLQIVRLDESGNRRYEAPLIHIGASERARDGDEWRLDGMIFKANDLVYAGVRDQGSGRLGKDWIGVPAELAKIDHTRHPYAHALGFLLGIRLRWAIGKGKDHLPISGATLLQLAGARLDHRRLELVWTSIRKDLAKLEHIGMHGGVEWSGEPWSLAGIVRVRPAQWILDRTVRGLHPPERPVSKVPLTGGEFAEWRTGFGWSQREAAKQLGVGQATLSGAESRPDHPLGPGVRRAVRRLIGLPD